MGKRIKDEEINVDSALLSLRPNAKWSMTGYNYDMIHNWNDNGEDKPSKAEVDSEIIRLQAEYDSLSWKRARQEEYPTIIDCIHALLDGGDTLTDLQTNRQATKDKYPK